jgi:hypothetical protein
VRIRDVEHQRVAIDASGRHAYNQVNVRRLQSGRLAAVFNEERFPFHHDSGQTVLITSDDDGSTWTEPSVVLPFTDTTGNWDCGICEVGDGTLVVNFTMAGYFKRGIRPEQPSWSMGPMTEEHGDWTWAYRTMSWLGTYTVRSTDGGATWSDPIPVNARPLKHAGCRLGAWPIGEGSLLLGVYGRIRGYGEEGENESTRAALLRSDDSGYNWEYYSTMAFDPASIVDYEEPAIVKLGDGRWIGMLRTHVNPSGDAKNLAMVLSEDDGFSWSSPNFTNIWGYPAEFATLPDGRILMIYGYRRAPYGVRGMVSDDGVTWDRADEFVIREGGVPQQFCQNPGIFQHIGYPSVTVLGDGSVLAMYHEYTDDSDRHIQHIVQTRFRVS